MKKNYDLLFRIIFICFIVLIGYLFFNTKDEKKESKPINTNQDLLEIYFLDVGEADSTYIHYLDYDILIDAGNTVDGKRIVSFLKDLDVSSFDSVFVTHAHEDHMGGMHWIVYKFPIEHFYMPNHSASWKSYENLINALDEEKVEIEEPSIGDEYVFQDLKLTVLSIGHSEDYNENSIVLKITFKNTTYLLMADAESDIEHQILNQELKSNVLKVGHHGSKKATSANFLYKVDPQYAIISVGSDNEYNHPHQVVLDKLNKMNCIIYRTDIDHTIHLKSDGNAITFDFLDTDLNGGDLSD